MAWFGNDDGASEETASGGRLARQAAASLGGLLAECGISRTELARQMNVSPGRVSQILSGDANLTMKSLAGAAEALGAQVEITFRPAPAATTAYEAVENAEAGSLAS